MSSFTQHEWHINGDYIGVSTVRVHTLDYKFAHSCSHIVWSPVAYSWVRVDRLNWNVITEDQKTSESQGKLNVTFYFSKLNVTKDCNGESWTF